MRTLLLDRTTWDLVTDLNGGIAVASDPYSVEQSVASACRTFLGECWYNTDLGIPYFENILGKAPPLALLKQYLVDAAQSVPGCSNAVAYITGFQNRVVSGQIQFQDTNQETRIVNFVGQSPHRFILNQSSLDSGDVI